MDYQYLSRAIGEGRAAGTVPRWSASVLRAVAGGRTGLRATIHPLGFACLPLVREGDYGVCIHAWLAGQRAAAPSTSPVHAHSWDLTSYVLFGQLRNELPVVVELRSGGTAAAARACQVLEVCSRGDLDEIRPTGRLVRCEPGESAVNLAGDVYAVPAGTFHSSVAEQTAPTATVALGKTVGGAADLSIGRVGTPAHQVRRNRCSREETAALARAIAGRLGAKGPP